MTKRNAPSHGRYYVVSFRGRPRHGGRQRTLFCGGLLDIVGIKRIGESQCVSSFEWLRRSSERGILFPSDHPFLVLIVGQFLYQLHCLIVPRSGSFNGDSIEDEWRSDLDI